MVHFRVGSTMYDMVSYMKDDAMLDNKRRLAEIVSATHNEISIISYISYETESITA